MNDPRSGDPIETESRLAGYVDGELSALDRQRVEDWLDRHPGAAEVLREQESLARSNREFWKAVEPPLPTAADWVRTCRAIAARCQAEPNHQTLARSRRIRSILAIAATGLLAAVGIWWTNRPEPTGERLGVGSGLTVAPAPRLVDDPLAGFAVLPVADLDEVSVESVHGRSPAWMYAADHPVPGDFTLAGPGDMTLLEIRPPAGRSEASALILPGKPE